MQWANVVVTEGMQILSSPIGFPGMIISFKEVNFPTSLVGAVTYVGHPATRGILEALGAEFRVGRWEGPKVGEAYLAVPLMHNDRSSFWTQHAAVTEVSQLRAILCVRVA